MEIPVYLFTGFLDAGKTSFIQKTLEDPRFNQGENTLLLICEEGVAAYEPDRFARHTVFLEYIDLLEDVDEQHLDRLCRQHACERVVIEFNGMWPLDRLYGALPGSWVVYQEFFFADANKFMLYHKNMQAMLDDKLASCEMAVLNRADDSLDRVAVHNIVRASNENCDIAFEAHDGSISYDDIQDALPFDIDAPVIEIELQHYAKWYRDLSANMEKYDGKTVRVEGFVHLRENLPDNAFILGRQLMTCCADDLAFAGILCVWSKRKKLHQEDWVTVTAKIILQQNKVYQRRGPLLQVLSVEEGYAPPQPIATFN